MGSNVGESKRMDDNRKQYFVQYYILAFIAVMHVFPIFVYLLPALLCILKYFCPVAP